MAQAMIDPRTELEIVDVPPQYGKYFSELQGAVIHFFGAVDKYNRLWRPQPRICILSDQAIYLCRPDGGITRCLMMKFIQELILSEQTAIGFRVGPPEYDMLLSVRNVQDREAMVHVVSRVYWAQTGQELVVRRLTGDSGEAMQQNLQLTKPDDWMLSVAPIASTKVLSKTLREQEERQRKDHDIVDAEFRRIKEGLKQELQNYRSEEYDRLTQQLQEYVGMLEKKDREIEHLKSTSVSLGDKEIWKACPNCADLRAVLESSPADDRQKILRLERQIASQMHIVEHLNVAINHRSANSGGAGANEFDESGRITQQLKHELSEVHLRNKELQQLIFESPHLSTAIKARAAKIAQHRDGAQAKTSAATRAELQDIIVERDREIRYLKGMMSEVTQRQLREIERVRLQLHRYDDQVVEYLEQVFAKGIPHLAGRAKEIMERAAIQM